MHSSDDFFSKTSNQVAKTLSNQELNQIRLNKKFKPQSIEISVSDSQLSVSSCSLSSSRIMEDEKPKSK